MFFIEFKVRVLALLILEIFVMKEKKLDVCKEIDAEIFVNLYSLCFHLYKLTAKTGHQFTYNFCVIVFRGKR